MNKYFIKYFTFGLILTANSYALIPGNPINPSVIETVIENESISINLKTDIKGTLINKGQLESVVNQGIFIYGGTVENNGELNLTASSGSGLSFGSIGGTLNNSGTINVTKNTGLTVGNNSTLTNSGEINILNNSVGIRLNSTTGNNIFENDGIINISSGSGVELAKGTTASFINGGIINVNSGNGVSSFGGTEITNNNLININGGTGVYVRDTSSSNIVNGGIVNIDSSNGKYIYNTSTTSSITNNNLINVNNGVGIQSIAGSNLSNDSLGIINIISGIGVSLGTNSTDSSLDVSGKNNGLIDIKGALSIGILASSTLGTTGVISAENNGTINIESDGGSIGLRANNSNGLIKNNKTGEINVTSTENGDSNNLGMGAYYGATAINEGTINVNGDLSTGLSGYSGGVDQAISSITNNGVINASNNATGLIISGTYTDIKNPTVTVDMATAENTGTINFTSNNQNEGKLNPSAVKINGGIFKNSGTINSNSLAIISEFGNRNGVILQNGSKISGRILGNDGTDALLIDNTQQSGLDIEFYEGIGAIGDMTISNSTLRLDQSSETAALVQEIRDSETSSPGQTDIINLAENNNIIIKTNGTTQDVFYGDILNVVGDNTKLTFLGTQNEYKLSDYFSGNTINITTDDILRNDASLVWDINIYDNDVVFRQKSYSSLLLDNRLNNFADELQNSLGNLELTAFSDVISKLNYAENSSQFTDYMKQLSGGIYGYLPNIVLTLSNSMTDNVISNIRLNNTSGITQDVVYINNKIKYKGLMKANFDYNGLLGITSKEITNNSIVGIYYGGAKGNLEFNNNYGDGKIDSLQIGAFYKTSLISNFNFIGNIGFGYNESKINRYLNMSDLNYAFKSKVKTKTYQIGAEINKDIVLNNFKIKPYLRGDIIRIDAGSINESNKVFALEDYTSQLLINTGSQNMVATLLTIGSEFSYYNLLFNKSYRIGLNLYVEKQYGNIGDNKLKLNAFNSNYKINVLDDQTSLYTSLFVTYDLTKDLATSLSYIFSNSSNVTNKIGTFGFEYKF